MEPVPGSDRLSLVFSPAAAAITAIAATTAIHAPITNQWWRLQKPPTR